MKPDNKQQFNKPGSNANQGQGTGMGSANKGGQSQSQNQKPQQQQWNKDAPQPGKMKPGMGGKDERGSSMGGKIKKDDTHNNNR